MRATFFMNIKYKLRGIYNWDYNYLNQGQEEIMTLNYDDGAKKYITSLVNTVKNN